MNKTVMEYGIDLNIEDVTLYVLWNTLFFYNVDTSSLSGLIRMGKITSNLSVFDALGAIVEMYVEIQDK